MPTNIFCSLHTSVCGYKPTTCNICQGYQTSGMACAHLASDVSQWMEALAKTCMHGHEICISRKWRRLMSCDMNQGPHEWTQNVRILQLTSASWMQPQPRPVYTCRVVCTSLWLLKSWSENIVHTTSYVASAHQRQKAATTKAYRHKSWRVCIDSTTSSLPACINQEKYPIECTDF